jgi:starch phosphorylase
MKAAANAVLNLSIPDGWWDEVWNDPEITRMIGWAIGKGEEYSDSAYQDQVEAEALYDILERDVIPTFYERGPDRTPRKWVERMKACVGSLCHFVNTHRMVRDYVEGYYIKAFTQFRALDADNARRARELAAALERIRKAWPEVWVEKVEDGTPAVVPVNSPVEIRVGVHLGRLEPQDVVVELYVGRVDMNGDLAEGAPVTMRPAAKRSDGIYTYVLETSIVRSGLHGYTVRVRPSHPDMSVPFIPGLISWAGRTPSVAIAA